MPTGAQPLRNGARVPRNMAPGAALASLQTNSQALRNVRYSYTETPTEFQRPTFEQFSPADSMIEESPISPRDGYRQNLAEQAMKAHIPLLTASTPQAGTPYYFPPPQEVHPAHFAPYADPAPLTREPHQFQQPQSPGPLPIKLDQEPASPSVANIHNDEPEERKANSPRVAPPTEQKPLVYNPDSLAGPNVTHGTHRPGQVSHPNAAVEPDWKHGLCEVDMLCCTGIVCPCMVYGKTQYRLSRKAQKQEPTDLLGYESCNSSCVVMAVACGFQGVLAAIQRNRVRRLYKLNGSLGSDCVKALCCCCCVVMQDEREVRDREELIRRYAGPAISAYEAPGTMAYAPPPR